MLEQTFNPTIEKPKAVEAGSYKMPVIEAIKLTMGLDPRFNSGNPKTWEIVKALRDGIISPESLLHQNR